MTTVKINMLQKAFSKPIFPSMPIPLWQEIWGLIDGNTNKGGPFN